MPASATPVSVEDGDEVMPGDATPQMVADVASQFGLTPRALRYYEQRGLLNPSRDAFNRRVYGGMDREYLDWIVALRQVNFPIDVIQDFLEHRRSGAAKSAMLALLEDRREALQLELRTLAGIEQRVANLPEH